MAIETAPSNPIPDLGPTPKPIITTPITTVSFTTPQVVAGNNEPTIFTPMDSHLTVAELEKEGTSWVKILTILMFLLLVLDGAVFGYNIFRGTQNPDLFGPIFSLFSSH